MRRGYDMPLVALNHKTATVGNLNHTTMSFFHGCTISRLQAARTVRGCSNFRVLEAALGVEKEEGAGSALV